MKLWLGTVPVYHGTMQSAYLSNCLKPCWERTDIQIPVVRISVTIEFLLFPNGRWYFNTSITLFVQTKPVSHTSKLLSFNTVNLPKHTFCIPIQSSIHITCHPWIRKHTRKHEFKNHPFWKKTCICNNRQINPALLYITHNKCHD